jgi:hypothetical protein
MQLMKKLFLSVVVVAFVSGVSFAGTKTVPVKLGKDKTVTPVEDLFHGNEFDVSIYGEVGIGRVDHYNTTETTGRLTNQIRGISPQARAFTTTTTTKHYVHDAWGGGVEADYFFTRYFGLGIEGDWLAGHDCISSVSGNLIGRYPFEYGTWGWAPYGFIGGGGQFDSQNAGFSQIGGGAEVRFKSHWGLFTDARWVIHDAFIDYALIRAGIRFNF